MIKCNVKVNGTIGRAAVVRASKDGKQFMTYSVNVVLSPNNGINKTINISVIKDSNDSSVAAQYVTGHRIEVEGVLYFKKRGSELYLDMSENQSNFYPEQSKDGIEGEMHFRGTLGKNIEMKTDKKNRPYLACSAYSAEKVADGFEYTWVRFIRFSDVIEDFLIPKGTIEVKGDMDLSVYNDNLNLGCRIKEMSKWVKQPYQEKKEELPF